MATIDDGRRRHPPQIGVTASCAIYVLKDTIYLSISEVAVGGSVPSSADMQAQAKVSLGRLP